MRRAGVEEIEDPRRRLLVRALGLGLIGGLTPLGGYAWSLFGDKPEKLPEGRSVYRVKGVAKVNGKPADTSTRVKPGDRVETGPESEIILAVGGQAMILREETQLAIEGEDKAGESAVINGLRLLTGKLLSVSRDAAMKVETPTATIGIRGTGWYAEAEPDQTYFCTCYGATDIAAAKDPQSRETVIAQHHDRPVYILADRPQGRNITNAPFINHTDQELALIEALVGREPPFVFPGDAYSRPRRDY